MIRDEDVHFHAADPGESTWAETNFFGFYDAEARLNVGVYALFRTNLGIVSSTICMNSGFARAPWEADFCDLRASLPIPEPRDLSNFKLANSLSIRCLKPNMDWQIGYDDGAGTLIDVTYRSIMPPFDIHDPDMDPMKAKALKAAAEAGGKFAWGTAYNGHFDQTGHFTGAIRVRGKSYAIDCISTMDHSWGPRPERGAPNMSWLHAHFSPDLAMHAIFSFDPRTNGRSLNNYLAWNIWDVLVMRATEGVSGMIPRQEYEILAFMQEFYRWPEVLQMTTDEIGAKGVMEIGASARREIGTKVNCVHDWCIGAVGLGMGRCGLLALEAIQPRDFVRESNTILKFMQRVLWGKRQDGYILNSQDRYRCQIHEKDVIEKLGREIERLEHGSEAHDAFVRFNAAAELLSFLDHYDCRLGLGDTGPYQLADGKIMIIRDLFTNEDVYDWSDLCEHEKVPHCYSLCLVIDPEKMGLDEIRVNDISTTFTRPKNYIEYIVGGAVFVREKWDTPMGEVYQVKVADLDKRLEGIQQATLKLYSKFSRMPRRTLIENGMYVYYIDMILPHLRLAGTYDKACKDYEFWEIDQRVANYYYYDIVKRGFAQATVPQKIFSGEGYLPFPDNVSVNRSKYFWK